MYRMSDPPPRHQLPPRLQRLLRDADALGTPVHAERVRIPCHHRCESQPASYLRIVNGDKRVLFASNQCIVLRRVGAALEVFPTLDTAYHNLVGRARRGPGRALS